MGITGTPQHRKGRVQISMFCRAACQVGQRWAQHHLFSLGRVPCGPLSQQHFQSHLEGMGQLTMFHSSQVGWREGSGGMIKGNAKIGIQPRVLTLVSLWCCFSVAFFGVIWKRRVSSAHSVLLPAWQVGRRETEGECLKGVLRWAFSLAHLS